MATETHILDTERAYENNKVLIVDDNLTSKAILEDILKHNGYETWYALAGKEGLRILAEWKPNVILLDLVMPGMDGYGVCRQVREMNLSPRPSVIIISVKDDKSSVVNSLACGADDFIGKPIDEAELLARVRAQQRIVEFYRELEEDKRNLETILDITTAMSATLDPSEVLSAGGLRARHAGPGQRAGHAVRQRGAEARAAARRGGRHDGRGVRAVRARCRLGCRGDDHDGDSRPRRLAAGRRQAWLSNAGIADAYVVFARSGEAPGAKGISAFIVDGSTPGLDTSERIDVIAPHPLGTVRLTDCRVGDDRLLGQAGQGFKIAMGTLDSFRTTVGAAALGFARRALDEATARARARRMFGRTLADFQLTQFKLGDGYPRGLKGKEIPIEGRIVKLVDEYDAHRSRRSYKPPFSHEEAFQIITEGDERSHPEHFSPEVLDAFVGVVQHFDDIYRENQDLTGLSGPAHDDKAL